MSSNFDNFLMLLSSPSPDLRDDLTPSFIASILDRLIQDPPRTWNEEKKTNILYAVRLRYNKSRLPVPFSVAAVLSIMELQNSSLVRLVQRTGPRMTSSVEACKDVLAGADARDMGYLQISSALLYMVITQNGELYDPGVFVTAIRQHRAGRQLDWQDVISSFDRESLSITKSQFLALFNALLPLSKEYENLNLQDLWGPAWTHQETQLSFVVAFLSCTPQELDASNIPRLNPAYSVEEFADASEEIKAYAAKAVSHPMVSFEATKALFTMIFQSQETYNHAQSLGIPETVINANTDIFVCAASAVEKPWVPLQEQAMKQLFYPFFTKSLPNYGFVLHALWKHDKQWLATKLVEAYSQNPMYLTLIFEHAQEHNWIDELLQIPNEFGLDLASLAYSHGLADLEQWRQQNFQPVPCESNVRIARAIVEYLRVKAEDDAMVQRDSIAPATVPLKVKTVYALLKIVQGHLPEEEMGDIQRQCLQWYPRLINYGGSFDHIIDANGEAGNGLSAEADAKMQDQYKRMYGGEVDPRGMIETLQHLKQSEDSGDQDLFACMIHGLFDEYNCFGEYPLEALATTAVLFGGIINFGLLSSEITLGVGLYMVLDAVKNYGPEDAMYKFGLQALLHFLGRLEEWPAFCDRLLRIPGLRGTEVYNKAEEIVRGDTGLELPGGDPERALTNGDVENFLPDPMEQPFASINVDPPTRSDLSETPDEDTSDRVMFALNNVSKRNLDEKFRNLQEALEAPHHQWFAHYLVEELVKAQPNFQSLYLQLLELFDLGELWQEVLRETYVSVSKILNAEATMNSSTERTSLKNLAVWLGLLTLARNKPILHRNIAFKEFLVEAHNTQRLLIAIPFTCKVLAQAAHSKIFKPPNPWLMELIGVLVELYEHAELKLNLKFEIEVLCKELGIDYKTVEVPFVIRDSLQPMLQEANYIPQYAPDAMDGFGDMHLMGLSKRGPNERFLPQDVLKSLPDLAQLLHYPPSFSNVNQQNLKHIFLSAATQAITEIIAPVVERSVTIAAISTSQLVEKDFAMEPDVDRLKTSAHNVVKALSGSLALVTCKEPLRMSITNHIRKMAAQGLPEQLPEGSILMFVNDNLDTVCKMVEDAAETQSMAEIDAQIEEAVERRRRHRETRPNEPFNYPPVSRWAFFIPEPYKQEPGGLNHQQLSIYEEFGRQMRLPPASHANNTSQDSNRPLPDVGMLTDNYLPNLPTPAEAPAMPRSVGQQQQRLQAPIGLQVGQGQPQTNGYADMPDVADRMFEALLQLQHTAREASEDTVSQLGPSSPVTEIFTQLMDLIRFSPRKDELAMSAGQRATLVVYQEAKDRLEIEVLVQFLKHLCDISAVTARAVITYLSGNEAGDVVFNAPVTVSLLGATLVDIHRVDVRISKAIQQRRSIAVDFLKAMLEELFDAEHVASALRADFVLSFGALAQWLNEEPENDKAKDVMGILQTSAQAPDGLSSPTELQKHDQLDYLFEEWVHLQRQDTPPTFLATFVRQLHSRNIISNRSDFATFLRVCVDTSIAAYEREETLPPGIGSIDNAYVNVDALAKLIVCLVVYQGEADGSTQDNKAQYLDATLCLVVLVINHHHFTRQERFNSKVFFRLLSSTLCELHEARELLGEAQHEMPLVLGRAFLFLQPRNLPAFAFSWATLISHRLFVPAVLRTGNEKVRNRRTAQGGPFLTQEQGWDQYVKILEVMLTYLGNLMTHMEHTLVAQEFYRGALRIILMLQHDFPDFLAENHLRLNSSVPMATLQIQNVINYTSPSSHRDFPDPFTPGLKINRLDQVRQSPNTRGDIDTVLIDAGVKDVVERVLNGKDVMKDEDVRPIALGIDPTSRADATASLTPPVPDALLINALVIRIGAVATIASSTFSAAAPSAKLLERLLQECRPEIRYHLLSAMANQLRYPNSHTHYFSTALLHLFAGGAEDLQQQIARVLIERLMNIRPHPWGLLVTIIELIKNPSYNVWELPWLKAAPEVERMLANVAQTQNVPQSPRLMM